MSSIVSAITNGGNGAGFQAKSANLINPATEQQATDQYGNVQQGLSQQQDFLKALQAQNGVQNQSNVFNQMQGVANGTGPNPAQAMLANSTGQNVANQAAMMAGQRGSGANAGMMARQAGQAGAGIQQNAAGQGAALQANQSLNALGQMGNMAGQQVGQQANQLNAYNQQAQGAQSNILGAINNQNQAAIGNASQQNQANAAIAAQNAKSQAGGLGGLFNAVGGLGGMMGGLSSAGSAIGGMFGGGGGGGADVSTQGTSAGFDMANAGNSNDYFNQNGMGSTAKAMAEGGPVSSFGKHIHSMRQPMMANGGSTSSVPALVSPGERYLSPDKVEAVAKGADPIKVGEKIPGKPKVGGAKNSYANDTVPKTLEEGGIVLPRSVTESKNPHWAAHKFVSAIMKEKALKGKK